MSKRIVSKSERWGGSVTIADPLTIPQAKLIEAASKLPAEIEDTLRLLADAEEAHGKDSDEYKAIAVKRFSNFAYDDQQLPAIFACVEKWELDNFPAEVTADNFPASPRGESHKLIEWIFQELLSVYYGEAKVPNA